LGIKYQINIASGAGFEYYTGIIFQFFIGGERVGGGGRYDALISSMGGGDIPASGFALYLDQLMGLVNPRALARPATEKIIVRAESADVLKNAFDLADRLRQQDYVAELDLDGKKIADHRVIKVRREEPKLILIDNLRSTRSKFGTIDELIKRLEAKNAD
jgi:histidyl-tRNA synthetase